MLGARKLHASRPSIINAEVKSDNLKSISVFSSLGFEKKIVNKDKHLFTISSKKLISANI